MCALGVVAAGLTASACGDDEPELTGAARVAVDMGLTEFLGRARISDQTERDGVTTWEFDPESGPLCMRGREFRMATRDVGSEDLLFFLQGGGACWPEFCLAVTAAPPGIPTGVDVLNPTLEANPFRDWNVAYLPYCDGSLFAGNRDHDDDEDGELDRFHRGLQNLSAGLDVARREFPSPRRVVLSGSSAGGFGTLIAAPLIRHVYPNADIFVLNDSGVGVAMGARDPGFVQRLVDQFNVERFFPADCPECLESGHITGLVDWYMGLDDNIRFGMFTSWYDGIIAGTFLQIPRAEFRDSIDTETGRTHEAFPDRYRRFIVDGQMHTTLLGNPIGIIGSDLTSVELPPNSGSLLGNLALGSLRTTAIGDLTLSEWIVGMLEGDDAVWVDIQEEPGTPPDEPEDEGPGDEDPT